MADKAVPAAAGEQVVRAVPVVRAVKAARAVKVDRAASAAATVPMAHPELMAHPGPTVRPVPKARQARRVKSPAVRLRRESSSRRAVEAVEHGGRYQVVGPEGFGHLDIGSQRRRRDAVGDQSWGNEPRRQNNSSGAG